MHLMVVLVPVAINTMLFVSEVNAQFSKQMQKKLLS